MKQHELDSYCKPTRSGHSAPRVPNFGLERTPPFFFFFFFFFFEHFPTSILVLLRGGLLSYLRYEPSIAGSRSDMFALTGTARHGSALEHKTFTGFTGFLAQVHVNNRDMRYGLYSRRL